jgi:hypothetical protein
MKIRIITKPRRDAEAGLFDGEILWEDTKNPFSPMETILPIDGKSLKLFQKDWEQFINRLLNTNPSRIEFREKLLKKSQSLEQMIFGSTILPWKSPKFKSDIFFQTDLEFTSYAWEILTTNDQFFFEKKNFYRGIRTIGQVVEKSKGTTFLLIENPVLANLEESVKMEGRSIARLFEDNLKIPLKRIQNDQFKLARFWEEISGSAYVHYAGHTEKGGIPFPKEDLVIGDEIGRSKLSGLKILFLNSCHSAYEGENTAGLSTQFLKAGAEYVLGFLTPIETEIAERIGRDFWRNYLWTKDARKAYLYVKNSLISSDTRDFASALSFVCFAPEDKKKSRSLLFTIFLCLALLLGLFTVNYFKDTRLVPAREEPAKQAIPQKINESPNLKPSSSLAKKIANLKNPEFRRKANLFLTEENPLLDQKEKVELLERVLSSSGNEDVKYYEFKREAGIE